MKHKLEADGIMLEFGNRKILTNIYLKCETQKIVGLLGRNGQGKTCLLNIIYGTLKATNKSIRFDNVSIIKAFERPDLLKYLPQHNFIPKSLTIKRVFSDYNLNFADFENLFPEFKIKYNSSIKSLSGGQRRLIEVYIIIKSKSQFAILDEPFSHLMPLHIEALKKILKIEKSNKGFIITDHMYNHIVDIYDDLYILVDGKANLTKSVDEIETYGYARL